MDPEKEKPETDQRDASRSSWQDHRFVLAAAVLLLVLLAWTSYNDVSAMRQRGDSSLFSAIGMHWNEGRVLYREAWDHKQPVVFMLNGWAMAMGDGTANSIRLMERLFLVMSSLCFLALLRFAGFSVGLAFVGALYFLLHFTNPPLIKGGNYTEVYAVAFVAMGLMMTAWTRRRLDWRQWPGCGLAGLFFSLAAFTKEPFILSSVPWFFWLIFARPVGAVYSWKRLILRSLSFIGGAFIPALIFLIYFWSRGALADWLDVFVFNFSFAENTQSDLGFWANQAENLSMVREYILNRDMPMGLLLALAVASFLDPAFRKRFGALPVFAAIMLLLDYFATSLSTNRHGHYYLQMTPAIGILCACGAAYLAMIFTRAKRHWRVGLIVVLLFAFWWDREFYITHARKRLAESSREQASPVAEYIAGHSEPGSGLWICEAKYSFLYHQADRLSPSRYLFGSKEIFIDTALSTRLEKIAILREDLQSKPPKFIIMASPEYRLKRGQFLLQSGIYDWVTRNYESVPVRLPRWNEDLLMIRRERQASD